MPLDLRLSFVSRSSMFQRIRRKSTSRGRGKGRRLPNRRHARFEPLEPRLVLSTETLNVTTTVDVVDPTDGLRSLREAMLDAHESTADTVIINLQSNATYTITQPTVINGQNSEGTSSDPLFGDFDISRDIIINGNGARIDANGLGRAFQISGAAAVSISELEIDHGVAPVAGGWSLGGAIYISGGSDVTLTDLSVHENIASGTTARGGAVYVDNRFGVVTVVRGNYFSNSVLGAIGSSVGDVSGGTFHVERGDVSFEESVITQSVARAATPSGSGANVGGRALGGAIAVGQATVELHGVMLDDNRAEGADGSANSGTAGAGGDALGGALYVAVGGSVASNGSMFIGNVAAAGQGGNSSGFVGGRGGVASGGAIFVEGGGEIDVIGGGLEGNQALGGDGGRGQDGGGIGGAARGGAIGVAEESPDNQPDLSFIQAAFVENLAMGGRGGDVTEEGPAGHGGEALGGAIFATNAIVRIDDTPFLRNSAEGGAGGNANKGRSGNGGLGSGGAIHIGGTTQLTLLSQLQSNGPVEDPESILASGLMADNIARGGHGGFKLNASADSDDAPGHGGAAQGGALTTLGSAIAVDHLAFFNNGAIAGNGGHGDRFAQDGGFGTVGGDGGWAYGGAIYAQADVAIEESAFVGNTAAGGRLEADAADGAFSGGRGGVDGQHRGLRGGNGGSAFGGAVYIGVDELQVDRSGFSGNQAIASNGGAAGRALNPDNNNTGNSGGQGGRGGDAFGGAIRAETSGDVNVEYSLFASNLVIAGRGGSGGRGADANELGGRGGNGGDGGVAGGGALSIHPAQISDPRSEVEIRETLIVANKVIAGDGGFAGNGGTGLLDTGGAPGNGGNGGLAIGGGLDLNNVDARILFTTVQENIVSSGWGANAGYGGSGSIYGGSFIDVAGFGGDAGDALGGGVAIQNGSLVLGLSTIVQNDVFSGFGGNGAWGGFGFFGGGKGGHGGDGGDARGGGIYNTGSIHDLNIFNATIAQNRLVAGGAGFAGIAGLVFNDTVQRINPDTPLTYAAHPLNGFPIVYGAASILGPESEYLGRGYSPPGFIVIPDLNGDFGDSETGLSTASTYDLDTAGAVSFAAAIPVVAASVYGGIYLGATAISVTAHTGIAIQGTTAGLTTVSGIGAGATILGGVSIGGAILSIGAIVATKAIWAGIETGDWEASFAFALGSPGNVSGVGAHILLQGIFDNSDDNDPPEFHGPGSDGQAGANGLAEGTNIWGSATLSRALIAEGITMQRTRSRSALPSPLGADHTLYVRETASVVSGPDVAGGTYWEQGANLVGAVDSGLEGSIHGTTAAPLDAHLDSQTRYNGGNTPTLRLLPLSPARGLAGNSSTEPSQNDYVWGHFYDIGAWGGGFNQGPTAVDDSFTAASGQVVAFAPSDLLANDTDPNGDPLEIVGNNVDGTAANGTLRKQTIVFLDGSSVTTFTYTPNPGFVGTETFTYVVTDGELFDTGTITIDVLPPPVLEVVDVRVSGSGWNSDNPALLAPVSLTSGDGLPLPWANLDQLELQFSDNVNISSSSLTLVGVNNAQYSPTNFSYDLTTFTATWTFAEPLRVDRYLLHLDGENGDAQPITAVSDGRLLEAGDFQLQFGILPGDVNGNGSVSVTDLVQIARVAVESGGGTFPANYDHRLDINGDGAIDLTDVTMTSRQVPQFLPTGTPQLPASGIASLQMQSTLAADRRFLLSSMPYVDKRSLLYATTRAPHVRVYEPAPQQHDPRSVAFAEWDQRESSSTNYDLEIVPYGAGPARQQEQIATDAAVSVFGGIELLHKKVRSKVAVR